MSQQTAGSMVDVTGYVREAMKSLAGLVEPFAEIVFVSATPYWGGGYTGRTFRCASRDCSSYEFLWQGADQIRGMLRWLARAAVASYIDDETLDERGYRGVEDYPARGTETGLLKRLFGSTAGKRAQAAAFALEAWLESDPQPFAEYKDVLGLLQAVKRAGPKALQILEQEAYSRLRSGKCKRDDFICLFAVPRFYLLALGAKINPESPESLANAARSLFELQPARPGTLVFRLRLRERPGAALRPEERFLLASLALAEPVLLGLGKSVSRGFGRFLPRKGSYSFNTGNPAYDEKLGTLAEILATKPDRSAIEQLMDTVLDAAARALGVDHEPYRGLTAVPRLSYALANMRYVEQLKHPCMLATREYVPKPNDPQGRRLVADYCSPAKRRPVASVLEALSAVGKAATKAVWKIYYYSYLSPGKRLPSGLAVKKPGVGFHTWVLGLPRQQQGRGYALGAIRVSVSECARPGRLDEGRRLSSVVVSVLPLGQGYAGIILPLAAAYDVPAKLLHGVRLLHVGEHGQKPRKRGVIVVTDVVAAAAHKHKRITPKGNDPRCRSWTKPMDAGVVKPGMHERAQSHDGKHCAEKALGAALDWLETLLK